MAVDMAKIEGFDKDERLFNPAESFYNNLTKFALFKCAYYLCHTCQNPYFGGLKDSVHDEAQ